MPVKNTDVTDLLEQKVALEQDNEALINQLKYYHAVLSILLELEGGAVEISAETLENYSLAVNINITKTEETNIYTIAIDND